MHSSSDIKNEKQREANQLYNDSHLAVFVCKNRKKEYLSGAILCYTMNICWVF